MQTQTRNTVVTPVGTFDIFWPDNSESPSFEGSYGAQVYVDHFLAIRDIKNQRGECLVLASITPDELMQHCNLPTVGITVLADIEDLSAFPD